MKKLVLAAVLLIAAAPAFAVNRTVLIVDDVIRMTKASVGDEQIVEFVRNSAADFEITGDDVIAMNEAKVSPGVMKFVIDESAARMKAARTQQTPPQQQQQQQAPAQYGGSGYDNDPQHVIVQHQVQYAGPTYPSAYPYYYDPYYAGYPYYSGYYPYAPYYYGYPYVSIGFGVGYGYGYYGGYYGHSHYYGPGGGYHGGHGGGGYHGGGGGHGGGGHGGGGHGGGGGHHGGGGHGGGGHH